MTGVLFTETIHRVACGLRACACRGFGRRLFLLLFSNSVLAADFHVGPGVDAANPGTAEKPFPTIERARDAARTAGGTGHVIILAPGRYFHSQPIMLDERDSGLTIKGAGPGAVAELHGGQPVSGWEKWKDGIWRAKVPVGQRFFNLIVDGRPATMAQTPDSGSGYGSGTVSVGEAETWKPREKVLLPDEWRKYDFSDAQVFAFHDSNWFSEMHAVLGGPDAQGHLLVTGGNMGPRLYLRGVLEFLDEPGEWCLKHKEGYVYYWPESGTPDDHLIVRSTTQKVIEVRGSAQHKPAKNITIENLAVIGSDFCASWNLFDPGMDNSTPDPLQQGMVFGENVERLSIRGCRLLAAGHSAVWLNRYAQNCVVENNLIMGAGFSGINMSGWTIGQGPFKGAADSYVNKGHRIEGNFIHDCGRFIGAGCGIQFYQSGDNLITRNEIGEMPRYGISCKGLRAGVLPRSLYGQEVTWDNHWDFLHTRNNRIQGNHIYSVCRNSHDFGAIESWGAGRGNVWDNNAVHDVDSALSWDCYAHILYADDHSHHLAMRNNILYHCHGGAVAAAFTMKSIGQVIENNLVVDNTLGRICTITAFNEPMWDFTIRQNVFAAVPVTERYKVGEETLKGSGGGILPGVPKGITRAITEINRNVIVPKDPANPNPPPYPEYGIDTDSYFGDPIIHRMKPAWDIQYGDYALAADSPAFKLGYKTIPTADIGLRPDFPFDKSAAVRRSALRKIQAENYQRRFALRTEGGRGIHHIGRGAWAKYANIDFGDGKITRVVFGIEASASGDNLVELRIGSPEGEVIGKLAAGQSTCAVANAAGVGDLYLVFPAGGVGSVDWFRFE